MLSPVLSLRHLASTAASSIAMPAPCAANGSIACAASPSRAIGALFHSPRSGSVNSAQRRHSSTAPISIRAVAGQRREANAPLSSLASPGALQPGLFQVPGTMATTLICRRARYRIGDEMRVRPHPELHARRGIFARQRGRIEGAAPGDQAGELRLHAPETGDCRTADQMPSAPISAIASSGCRALPRRWTTVSPLACEVTSSNWQPSRKSISGMIVDLGLQGGLQIGAMHHPIGRAGAQGWRPRRAAGGRSRRLRARS